MDVTSLLYHRGVSRFTYNLYIALSQLKEVEMYAYASAGPGAQKQLRQEVNHLLALSEKNVRNANIGTANAYIGTLPVKWREILWHQLQIYPVGKKLPLIQVFHSWDFLQPPDRCIPLVSTIHDLAMLKYPETANPSILRHHQESWQILKNKKAHVTVDSLATKRDVIELLEIPAERVHLVYPALPKETIVQASELTDINWQIVKNKFNLEHEYILFVGTREPRKNLTRIIAAWQKIRDEVELVIVGAKGWDDVNLEDRKIHWLENVNDKELAHLYKHAQMLVYPSLYEGFGLPILESFYYGTPVMTSKNTATAEVGGMAAVLVDPIAVDEIEQGIQMILSEDQQQKKKRQQEMRKQLQKFSWEAAAEETYKVYQTAVEDFYE